MAKNIWINATIKGCAVAAGKVEMQMTCGNFPAYGDCIYTTPNELKELPKLTCFVKGMVNSSQNALVRTEDSWGPLGRMSTRFDLKHGVPVHRIVNNFSRDGDIDCVQSRDDAEKLCLLTRQFPYCPLSLLQIAEMNDFDIERITARGLKTLELAIISRIQKHAVPAGELRMDDRVKAMVIAGI